MIRVIPLSYHHVTAAQSAQKNGAAASTSQLLRPGYPIRPVVVTLCHNRQNGVPRIHCGRFRLFPVVFSTLRFIGHCFEREKLRYGTSRSKP